VGVAGDGNPGVRIKRERRVFGFSLEQFFQVISTQPGLMKNVK
jgi:hypothetical protein